MTREEWEPISIQIGKILPGSAIYLPGLEVRDVNSRDQLPISVFGFLS